GYFCCAATPRLTRICTANGRRSGALWKPDGLPIFEREEPVYVLAGQRLENAARRESRETGGDRFDCRSRLGHPGGLCVVPLLMPAVLFLGFRWNSAAALRRRGFIL